MTWGPGTLILNRYRLESLLGRGGMGSVWRAEHLQLKSPVAVKLLDPSIANNEQVLGRFLREAQAAAALRSPHVVQIFDYGVEDGTAFIAMEMLHGQSLSERIVQQGKVAPEETFRFLQQVLRAIGKAHEAGIVHRDLKPDNIFICQDEPEFAKVLDFGVAKVKNADLGGSAGSKTQTGMMIGTPYYMSPEQTQAKDIDARADLWAIGIIAYECITGTRPFTGDSFGELVIAINTKPVPLPSKQGPVPAGFDEWFVKATQRDRERRFHSAKEMADELSKVGGAIGAAARSAVLKTQQTPAVVPVASAQTSVQPAARDLQLTTGARSATTRSVGESQGKSPLVLGLVALGTLIVVGAGAFVAFGGVRALRGADAAVASEPPSAAVLPPAAPVAPPPSEPAKAATSEPAPAIAPAAPSAAPSVAPETSAAPAKATTPALEKPRRPSEKPTDKPGKPAAPPTQAPPKDWNF
jgi:eukaryotic-like serine/threonine-protein kinase